ncbi:conserved hypothetical protein [Vibrio coralliirubri]|nr:conserved hypothetical protein [Vibrio coralliirubri]
MFPHFDIPRNRSFLPAVYFYGTNPIHAAKFRPLAKSCGSPTKDKQHETVIGPMPGIV